MKKETIEIIFKSENLFSVSICFKHVAILKAMHYQQQFF